MQQKHLLFHEWGQPNEIFYIHIEGYPASEMKHRLMAALCLAQY